MTWLSNGVLLCPDKLIKICHSACTIPGGHLHSKVIGIVVVFFSV